MSVLAQGDLNFEKVAVMNEICFPATLDGDEMRRKLAILFGTIVVVGSMVYLRAMLLLRPWNC